MKKLITIIALLVAFAAPAQSGQDRAMLQQIALLKKYGGYVKKGYRIAKDGLTFIGNLKEGELDLHALFFDGLESVSPFVRQYPKVAAILTLANRIRGLEAELSGQLANDLFHGNEKAHALRVLGRLLSGCADDLEELRVLLADGDLVADDADRIARIDTIFKNMQEKYSFIQRFSDDCHALAAARQHELHDIRQARELHNLNPRP